MTNTYNNNLLLQLDALILSFKDYKYTIKKHIFNIINNGFGFFTIKLEVDITSDNINYNYKDYLYNLLLRLRDIVFNRINNDNNIIFIFTAIFPKVTSKIVPINITLFGMLLENIFSIVPYNIILVTLGNVPTDVTILIINLFEGLSRLEYKPYILNIAFDRYAIDESLLLHTLNRVTITNLKIEGTILPNKPESIVKLVKMVLGICEYKYIDIELNRGHETGIVFRMDNNSHIARPSDIEYFNKYVMEIIIYIIDNNDRYTSIDLGRLYTIPDSMKLLFTYLTTNTRINDLNLHNVIGYYIIDSISEVLKTNNTLSKIIISKNGINDEYIKNFFDMLAVNKSLTYIDLSGNRITDEGIKYLAGALLFNNTLEYIDLSDNDIDDEGIILLAESLVSNKSVKELKLDNNNIGNDGARALVNMLQTNFTIEKLTWEITWNVLDIDENLTEKKNELLKLQNRKQRSGDWYPRTHKQISNLDPEFNTTIVDMLSMFEKLKQKRDEEKLRKRMEIL
jgi:hypothetical protein